MLLIILKKINSLNLDNCQLTTKSITNLFKDVEFNLTILSLFGNDFKKGYLALIIIATGAFFNSITGNVDQILNMTGNEQKVIRVMFVGFVLNILLNFMLIPNYGYVGAAFASFVVNIVVNTIFVIVIRKKLGFYTFI